MKQTALTFYIFAAAFLLGALFIPPMAVLRIVTWKDPSHRIPGRLMRFYGRLLFRMMPGWHFTIEGSAPEDIGSQSYVVIANHQTTGDVFLLSNMPWDMRWVSKVELMKFVPVLGLLLWLSGDIPVRRGDKSSVVRMMERCRETLKNGLSVMLFPEGTRAKLGPLGNFKDGAFRLAIETGRPVLPLAVDKTLELWPCGTFALGAATGVVRILPPISTQGMSLDDLTRLKDLAREAIRTALEDMRGHSSADAPPKGPDAPTGADSSADTASSPEAPVKTGG